jgi:hypothetical protein
MFFRVLSIIFVFSLSFSARADWSLKTESILNDGLPPMIKTYPEALISFWGGFRRYFHWAKNKGSIVEVESSLFKSSRFPLYLYTHPNPKAPLYIFMPGIYGQPHKGITQNTIDYLEKLEGSLLVVPNILSTSYVEANPHYKDDVVASEVAVMEEALGYALSKLPEGRRSVHLIAESLGSSVAVAWVAQDQAQEKRISDLLLLWPPLNLHSAMKNFDFLIDSYRSYECSTIGNLVTISSSFLFTTYPENLSLKEQHCMGQVMLVDGFLKSTKASLEAYQKLNPQLGQLPEPEGFEHFFQHYRPEIWGLLSNQDPKLSLSFWIKKFSKNLPIKIISSENDFLNRNLSWNDFSSETQLKLKEDILILDWGGHSGSFGSPKFTDVLKMIYQI